MGTWGTGIEDNDTASEVIADYYSLLETMSVEKVMERMIDFYRQKIESPEESNNFWLALASVQLETNTLQADVAERVRRIIETEADLLLWKELKASANDLELRKKELADFLTRLNSSFKK